MLRGAVALLVVLLSSATNINAAEPGHSLGISMQRIPAGSFMMGGQESKAALSQAFKQYETRRIDELVDEYPAHRVQITKPFLIGKHEVTIGQFRKFVERSGYRTQAETDGTGGWGFNRATGQFEGRKVEYHWQNPGFSQTDSHPVVNVSWYDTQAFCEWLTKTEGRVFRLPTEAEWEYACRAGSTQRFHFGDDPELLTKHSNIYDANTKDVFPEWANFATRSRDGFQFTAPVGSFTPNAFGLHDMHGNVWEWCSDWHAEDYYANSPINDPQGPADGNVKVRRGGSWHTWPFYCRASFRNWNAPTTRYVLVGFRVVAEMTP